MGKCGTRLGGERLIGDAVGLQAWLQGAELFRGQSAVTRNRCYGPRCTRPMGVTSREEFPMYTL